TTFRPRDGRHLSDLLDEAEHLLQVRAIRPPDHQELLVLHGAPGQNNQRRFVHARSLRLVLSCRVVTSVYLFGYGDLCSSAPYSFSHPIVRSRIERTPFRSRLVSNGSETCPRMSRGSRPATLTPRSIASRRSAG